MGIIIGIGILILISVVASLIGNLWGTLETKRRFKRMSKRKTNGLDNKVNIHAEMSRFPREQFSALYDNSKYKEFLLTMIETIRTRGNAPKLEEYNYPISEWVSKHSIDPIVSIPNWFSWIESFRKDNRIFDYLDTTYNVRVRADNTVREFVKTLEDSGALINVSEIDKLSESIFIKASMDNLLINILLDEMKK